MWQAALLICLKVGDDPLGPNRLTFECVVDCNERVASYSKLALCMERTV